jgi:triacylglycerol esterase/lipase EstA (alpha/beta hydrolase family)
MGRIRQTLLALTGMGVVLAPLLPATAAPPTARLPVLVVHGIDDTHQKVEPICQALRAAGWDQVATCDMVPNNGDAGIAELARQVKEAAQALQSRTGATHCDVVAFSMGALVSRYWLQRLAGKEMVRRFISIAAPHGGTLTAYARWNAGATDMRPGSPLLQDLQQEPLPWGDVQVTTFWTPFDLMILPASSGRLEGAVDRTFPVLAHPWMLTDRRVQRAIIQTLSQ